MTSADTTGLDTHPFPLADEDDHIYFDESTCVLRTCIHYCVVQKPEAFHGSSHYLVEGQVGLTCVFCKDVPTKERVGNSGAMSFPGSMDSIYRNATGTVKSHILKCQTCPQEVKDRLNSNTRSAKGAKKMWMVSAGKKGLFTAPKGGGTQTGIFLRPGESNEPVAASAPRKSDDGTVPVGKTTVDEAAAPVTAETSPAPPAASMAAPGGLASCRADAGTPDMLAHFDAIASGTNSDLLEDFFNPPVARANVAAPANLSASGALPGPSVTNDDMDFDALDISTWGVDNWDVDFNVDNAPGTIVPSSASPSIAQANYNFQHMTTGTMTFDDANEISHGTPPPSSDQTGPRPAQVTPENCPASASSANMDIDMDLFDDTSMMM